MRLLYVVLVERLIPKNLTFSFWNFITFHQMFLVIEVNSCRWKDEERQRHKGLFEVFVGNILTTGRIRVNHLVYSLEYTMILNNHLLVM